MIKKLPVTNHHKIHKTISNYQMTNGILKKGWIQYKSGIIDVSAKNQNVAQNQNEIPFNFFMNFRSCSSYISAVVCSSLCISTKLHHCIKTTLLLTYFRSVCETMKCALISLRLSKFLLQKRHSKRPGCL